MMADIDEKICKQMEGLVELLTTSGKPVLNAEIMKKFKKFCRISDAYVEYAYKLLMKQLAVKHAEVRLSAYQMIDELFLRSHMFRELLLASFDTFLELSAGTERKNPLPPPKTAAENMQSSVNRSILLWVEKFGHAYRKLTLGFEFLKNFKKIDFDSIQASLDLERRQKEETERKLDESRREKLENVNKEYSESEFEIQLCLTEVENGLQLLMPRPDNFFISLKDGVGTSSKINSLTSTMTSATLVDEEGKHALDEITSEGNKVNCKHKPGQNDGFDLGRSDSIKINVNDSGNVVGKSESVSGPLESDKRSDDDKEDDEDDDEEEDFEEVAKLENGEFTQEHGLFDRKFALTVELGHGGSRLQENEDNQDLIQGVRDQYTLIKTKYLPAVKRWLQVLSDNSVKEEKVKQMVAVKNKLEDAIKKCVELEIAKSKSRKNDESDSDEDDFEEVPVKEGYEEDVPEHVRMEAVMATSRKSSKSGGRKKTAKKVAKTKSKPTQKKLGIKNAKQMAREILDRQRLLDADDLDSAVLKSKASYSRQKSAETSDKECGTFLSLSQNEDRKVPVSQESTSKVQVSAECTCKTQVSRESTNKAQISTESISKTQVSQESTNKAQISTESISKTQVSQESTNKAQISTESEGIPYFSTKPVCRELPIKMPVNQSSDNKLQAGSEPSSGSINMQQHEDFSRVSLLEKAPYVNFGVDLEHWECPEKIKAPVKNRFDNASRFWVPEKEVDDQNPGCSEEVAALTRRSYTYAGEFVPVKWKCRAPLSDGRLCERMDRIKCPFHGRIIGRDTNGVPTDSAEAEKLLKQTKGEKTERETSDSSTDNEGSSSGSKGKGEGKGKGKKRAKKRKYPNLTDINESNDSSRTRLEAKIFNRSTLRKVNKALDAAALKKLANKFSNQFNYSLK